MLNFRGKRVNRIKDVSIYQSTLAPQVLDWLKSSLICNGRIVRPSLTPRDFSDADVPEKFKSYIPLNKEKASSLPVITEKKTPLKKD